MSATRLLILGVLRFMQPAHGYSVRQELESWQADRWANVAFGSISFALHKMAEEGLLDALDPEQTGRRSGRISYVVTPRGEEAFRRPLHEHLWGFKSPVDPSMAAAAFKPELSREELLAALRHRLALARSTLAGYEFMTGPRSAVHGRQAPPRRPDPAPPRRALGGRGPLGRGDDRQGRGRRIAVAAPIPGAAGRRADRPVDSGDSNLYSRTAVMLGSLPREATAPGDPLRRPPRASPLPPVPRDSSPEPVTARRVAIRHRS